MIALSTDCLLFQLTNGESVPCSAEMISIEIVGNTDGLLDPEMLRHAAASVFHYFKIELERETVTVGEFAGALEKVLREARPDHPRGRARIALAGNHRDRSGPARAAIRRQPGTFFLSAIARRTAPATPPIAARAALSRTARLRQAACRRATLERALRKNAGTNRRIPARLPDRRAGAERVRARRGIKL